MLQPPPPPQPPAWQGEPPPSGGWGPPPAAPGYQYGYPGYPPPGPPGPANRTWAVAIGLSVLAILSVILFLIFTHNNQPASGGATPRPSPSSNAAEAAYSQAVHTMRNTPGFHYEAQTTGVITETVSGDAGKNSGSQQITTTSTYGAEQFSLILLNGVVYFQGNVPALEDQLGVSSSAAPGLVGKWVSLSVGQGPYNVLAPGITVSDQAQEIPLIATAISNVTSSGVSAIKITGNVPEHGAVPQAAATLTVASSTYAAIDYTTSLNANGITVTSKVTFTKWGVAPQLTAPGGAVDWSTLNATEPPGGYGSGGGGTVPTAAPGTTT